MDRHEAAVEEAIERFQTAMEDAGAEYVLVVRQAGYTIMHSHAPQPNDSVLIRHRHRFKALVDEVLGKVGTIRAEQLPEPSEPDEGTDER